MKLICSFRWLRVLSVCIPLCALVQSHAQVPRDNAWQVLQSGAKENDKTSRAIAIRSLGLAIGDKEAEKLAVAALQDPVAEVRMSAAIALGKMEARSSIPALKEALKDKEVGVVLAATSALRALGDPSCYLVYYAVLTGERKSGDSLVAEQKKMLNDPKKMAQFGFEQGIGFIPFAGIGYSAFKTLTKDDESPIRAAAAVALATDPDPKSGKALLNASQDKSWIVRTAALDAIARRGDPSMVPDIVNSLTDSKPEVKYTAAAAIYYLSGNPRPAGK